MTFDVIKFPEAQIMFRVGFGRNDKTWFIRLDFYKRGYRVLI